MELFKLFGSILVDSAEAEKSISKTGDQAETMGGKLLNGIKTAGKWAAAVTGAAVAVGGAMVAAAKGTAEDLDVIDKASQRMNITAEAYQELAYQAELCGVEMSTMEKAAKKLEGTDLSMDDALKQIYELGTAEERSAKAAELFGDAVAYQMSPMLNQSADDMAAMADEARNLGLVIDDDTVAAGANLDDMFTKVEKAFSTLKTQLVTDFMPYAQKILDWLLQNMPRIRETVKKVMDSIWPIVEAVLNLIMEALPPLLDAIQKFIDWIMPYLEPVIDAITNLVEGFIALINGDFDGFFEGIKGFLENIFDAADKIITGIFDFVVGILEKVIGKVKDFFADIIQKIKDKFDEIKGRIHDFVEEAKEKFKNLPGDMLEIGKKIFTSLWDGIKGVWEDIKNWIGEKVDWLKDKLEFWKKGKKEMDGGEDDGSDEEDGSHASGIPYVPFDGYVAELHRGERVLTALQAQEASRAAGTVQYAVQEQATGVSDAQISKLAAMIAEAVRGSQQDQRQPVELVINLNGQTLARELYDDLQNERTFRGSSLVTV